MKGNDKIKTAISKFLKVFIVSLLVILPLSLLNDHVIESQLLGELIRLVSLVFLVGAVIVIFVGTLTSKKQS
jgi:hypothetical protein